MTGCRSRPQLMRHQRAQWRARAIQLLYQPLRLAQPQPGFAHIHIEHTQCHIDCSGSSLRKLKFATPRLNTSLHVALDSHDMQYAIPSASSSLPTYIFQEPCTYFATLIRSGRARYRMCIHALTKQRNHQCSRRTHQNPSGKLHFHFDRPHDLIQVAHHARTKFTSVAARHQSQSKLN